MVVGPNGLLIAKAPRREGERAERGVVVTEEEESRRRRQTVDKEEAERMERLRSELRGRDYTYDAEGNVILVDLSNPERLPSYQLSPHVALASEPLPTPPPQGRPRRSAGKGSSGGGKGGGSKGGGVRDDSMARAQTEMMAQPTFKALDSLQPSLLETMSLAAGVTLREGEGERSGGDPAYKPERMSKKEFDLFARTSHGGGGGGGGGGVTLDDASGGRAGGGRANDAASRTMANPAEATRTASSMLCKAAEPAAPAAAVSTKLPVIAREPGVASPTMRHSQVLPLPPARGAEQSPPGQSPKRGLRVRGGTGVKERLPPPNIGASAGHGLDPYATARALQSH